MINFPRFKRQALRWTTGAKTYAEMSDRQWEIHPAETAIAPPAIYLDGALDRVTGVQAETTRAWEQERIRGGLRPHHATIAYQLRDIQIRQGYVYKQALRLQFTRQREAWRHWGEVAQLPEAALACSLFGYNYFGHLLLDDLPLALAAAQIAPAITLDQSTSQQIAAYQTLTGIQPQFVAAADCSCLTLIDDIGQNRFKRDRLRTLRSRLALAHSGSPPRGVMLLRGQTGTRRTLVNEAEVVHWLQTQGFVCVVPEALSVPELLRQIGGAKIIIGVEGSQLAHGVYSLAAGGVMCTLQPPDRFNNVFKDYLDCLDQDLRYAFVVGRPAAHGFTINLADLARTLEQIDPVFARRC